MKGIINFQANLNNERSVRAQAGFYLRPCQSMGI